MRSQVNDLVPKVPEHITAHARQLSNNDTRIEIERAAGELLKLAS